MRQVQHRAVLHEKAVQKIARGELELPKRRNHLRSVETMVNRYVKTDEAVQTIIRDSGAPVSHVQYFDDGSVVIWNHPAPWPEVTA